MNQQCQACGHDRVFHGVGTRNGVPIGQAFCDDRHAAPCNCTGFVVKRPMIQILAVRYTGQMRISFNRHGAAPLDIAKLRSIIAQTFDGDENEQLEVAVNALPQLLDECDQLRAALRRTLHVIGRVVGCEPLRPEVEATLCQLIDDLAVREHGTAERAHRPLDLLQVVREAVDSEDEHAAMDRLRDAVAALRESPPFVAVPEGSQ